MLHHSAAVMPQGVLTHPARSFGSSAQGLPLQVYGPADADMLVMASIHGDENLGTVLLSECLRTLSREDLSATVILVCNPDGVLAGTRCNAHGVDLNRNFPATNWCPDPVYYRNGPAMPQNIPLSPGSAPGSEPETQALIQLVQRVNPQLIVSLHGFLGCIDDPESSMIARDLARRTGLDLVADVGYATPGSFGSWCAETGYSIITYELPLAGIVALRDSQLPALHDLLTGGYTT